MEHFRQIYLFQKISLGHLNIFSMMKHHLLQLSQLMNYGLNNFLMRSFFVYFLYSCFLKKLWCSIKSSMDGIRGCNSIVRDLVSLVGGCFMLSGVSQTSQVFLLPKISRAKNILLKEKFELGSTGIVLLTGTCSRIGGRGPFGITFGYGISELRILKISK